MLCNRFFSCRKSFPFGAILPTVLLFAGIAAFCVETSFGRDIYVNNKTGNDRRTGFNKGSEAEKTGPVRTIRRALELARNGDRIILQPTGIPFHESITLTRFNHGGSKEMPFTIEGNGAVLDGTEPLDPRVWEHESGALFRFVPPVNRADLQYFRIFDRKEPLTYVEPEPGAPRLPQLEPNSWTLWNGKIYFMAEPGKRPDVPGHYDFVQTVFLTGITLFHVEHVQLRDLTIQGFQIDGISAFNSAREIVLDNVLCANNGRSGLNIGGASRLYAGYCTFEGNLGEQVIAQPHSRSILYACRVTPTPDPNSFQDRLAFAVDPDGEAGAQEVEIAEETKFVRLPMPEKKVFVPTKTRGYEEDRPTHTRRSSPARQSGATPTTGTAASAWVDEEDPFADGEETAAPTTTSSTGMQSGDLDEDDPFADENETDTPATTSPAGMQSGDLDEDDPFADEEDKSESGGNDKTESNDEDDPFGP